MIKIDKEILTDSIHNIENLSNDYEEILDRISKINDEMQITSLSKKIFPNIVEQIEIMKDDLEKLGIESIQNLASNIEEIIENFEENDENMRKGINNGNKI